MCTKKDRQKGIISWSCKRTFSVIWPNSLYFSRTWYIQGFDTFGFSVSYMFNICLHMNTVQWTPFPYFDNINLPLQNTSCLKTKVCAMSDRGWYRALIWMSVDLCQVESQPEVPLWLVSLGKVLLDLGTLPFYVRFYLLFWFNI